MNFSADTKTVLDTGEFYRFQNKRGARKCKDSGTLCSYFNEKHLSVLRCCLLVSFL